MSHSHHRLKQFATLRVLKGYVMESGSRIACIFDFMSATAPCKSSRSKLAIKIVSTKMMKYLVWSLILA